MTTKKSTMIFSDPFFSSNSVTPKLTKVETELLTPNSPDLESNENQSTRDVLLKRSKGVKK
jgi:hypothetical protein